MSHTKAEELEAFMEVLSNYIKEKGFLEWSQMDNDQREQAARLGIKHLHEIFDPESRHFVFSRSIDPTDDDQVHAIDKSLWNHTSSEEVHT